MAFRQKVHPQQVGDHLGIGAVIFLLRSGDRLQHLGMGHFQINSVRLEEIVNPASENSCFHRSDPGTRQSLHPFAKRLPVCINLSLADKTAIQGFDAISYYPLVNVQPDVVKYVHGNLLVVSFWASQSRPSRLPHANILNHLGVSFNTDHLYIQTLPYFPAVFFGLPRGFNLSEHAIVYSSMSTKESVPSGLPVVVFFRISESSSSEGIDKNSLNCSRCSGASQE